MSTVRIALANVRYPATRDESVAIATTTIAESAGKGAAIVCFPEAYVPGYRWPGKSIAPPDPSFQEQAWKAVAAAAGKAGIAVVLGTERIVAGDLRLSALVVGNDGAVIGFQDKVQLDPSEDGLYSPGSDRQLFEAGGLKFGIVICHEGWRYPETVRWAARRGAQLVFHPHYHEAEPGSYRPTTFADPANTFHEKAILCRAAENTCYVASVNCASDGSPTTSCIANPEGTLLAYQPYGQEGLLIADLDLDAATGSLAKRCRTVP